MIHRLPTGDSALQEFEHFQNIAYIVTDLDGTVIQGNAPLQKQIRQSIHSIQKRGTFFSVATGRTYSGAKALIDGLGIRKGMPIAFYNGGVVMEYGTNRVIDVDEISPDVLPQLFSLSDRFKINLLFYVFRQAPNTSSISELVFGTGPIRNASDVNQMEITWLNSVTKLNDKIISVLIDRSQLAGKKIEQVHTALAAIPSLACKDSGSGFIEIKSARTDKGNVVNALRKMGKADSSKAKILAVGDNDNDIELFLASDISVVVSNASTGACRHADYICGYESGKGFLDLLNVIKNAQIYF